MKYFVLIFTLFSFQIASAQNVIASEQATYEGITHLEVEGSFAKVEIVGSSRSDIDFVGEITGRGDRGDIEIRHEKSGNRLHVWVDRKAKYRSWGNTNGHLTFKVPENIILNIDNSSGGVYAENIKSSSCRLEASSGSVRARDITANTHLETSSGRIEATGIVGELDVESSSGGQKLRDIKGDIRSIASSGRISLENVTGKLNLRNSSGGLTGDNITITGNSKFKSTSGSIKMDLTNSIEEFTFDCTASSGSIYIGDKKVGKKAYYKYGNILIEGDTTSGGQKYGKL